MIDKLLNGLILPLKPFVTPIPPHFSLYILFCMCLISPTKRTTPAQAQQCRFAFSPSFVLMGFWDSRKKLALLSSCLQVVFDIHCPAAVLTTWIRSEQNAAFWKTACCWRETDDCLLELNKWLSSSQALVHGWCCQMGNLWLCPLGADGSHFSPNTGFVVSLVCAVDWLVTLERKRHHVGGIWGWDRQPVWPIGRCGAFRFPWERWQLGLLRRLLVYC